MFIIVVLCGVFWLGGTSKFNPTPNCPNYETAKVFLQLDFSNPELPQYWDACGVPNWRSNYLVYSSGKDFRKIRDNYVCSIRRVESYDFKCRNRYIRTHYWIESGSTIEIDIPLRVSYQISVQFSERCDGCPAVDYRISSKFYSWYTRRVGIPAGNILYASMKYIRLNNFNLCSQLI